MVALLAAVVEVATENPPGRAYLACVDTLERTRVRVTVASAFFACLPLTYVSAAFSRLRTNCCQTSLKFQLTMSRLPAARAPLIRTATASNTLVGNLRARVRSRR